MDLGVNVAIFANNQILLTKREDFEIWCLPGGGVDPNESLAAAAVREAYEETGLEVRLTRLVGVYSRPDWRTGAHSVLFAATPVGGALRLCDGETIDVGYFALDALPDDLVPDHIDRIRDAAAGYGGSVAVTQPGTLWQHVAKTRQELYALRDQSDLSRLAFFYAMMDGNDLPPSVTDVAGRTGRWE
jgi:ADP-ribose pyrophosphatase YjhB (NUDIX family)